MSFQTNFKTKTYRNRKYLDWLKELPCHICGKTPCDPCHIGVSNFKIKPPDNQALPMCREHHTYQEYHSWKFEELTGKPLPTVEDCEQYFQEYTLKYGV